MSGRGSTPYSTEVNKMQDENLFYPSTSYDPFTDPLNVPDRGQPKMSLIGYKFDEGRLINELKDYIDSTYDQHYAKGKIQATEVIIDGGHGEGFLVGNIVKYALRYGKKAGWNRNDLLKILHYAIILLSVHDRRRPTP